MGGALPYLPPRSPLASATVLTGQFLVARTSVTAPPLLTSNPVSSARSIVDPSAVSDASSSFPFLGSTSTVSTPPPRCTENGPMQTAELVPQAAGSSFSPHLNIAIKRLSHGKLFNEQGALYYLDKSWALQNPAPTFPTTSVLDTPFSFCHNNTIAFRNSAVWYVCTENDVTRLYWRPLKHRDCTMVSLKWHQAKSDATGPVVRQGAGTKSIPGRGTGGGGGSSNTSSIVGGVLCAVAVVVLSVVLAVIFLRRRKRRRVRQSQMQSQPAHETIYAEAEAIPAPQEMCGKDQAMLDSQEVHQVYDAVVELPADRWDEKKMSVEIEESPTLAGSTPTESDNRKSMTSS